MSKTTICILMAFLVSVALLSKQDEKLVAFPMVSNNKDMGTTGKCECGAFKSKESDDGAQPIVTKSALITTCNTEGFEICSTFCKSLAVMAREKGPQTICKIVVDAASLEVSLHTQVCEGGWQYSGWTSLDPLCCKKGEVTPCEISQ